MHANAEFLTRPNAASGLVGRSAATTGPWPPTAAGRECNQVEAEQIFERRLKLFDLLAELKLEACLGLRVQVAGFHARVEIERLAIDGREIVRGVESTLVFAIGGECIQAALNFAEARR